MSEYRTSLEEALAASRTRSTWNDRLVHWERPASKTEEAKIQRAASTASHIVNSNLFLITEGAQIRPQGSYFNNTNVRLEADMDLRVQLPLISVDYAIDVDPRRAYQSGGYSSDFRRFVDIAKDVRNALAADCRDCFGTNNVTVGKKAITVDGLSGSGVDVDLVPAFRLHWMMNDGRGGYDTIEGIVIVGTDGSRTINFPEQHHANGMTKREHTQHRFKKVVRMLKRLNYELEEHGSIPKRVPSFLVECLVYIVEDRHFLEDEDRYDRLRRVCGRIQTLLFDPGATAGAREVNDIKLLFHPTQAWTLDQARRFIAAVLNRLEA